MAPMSPRTLGDLPTRPREKMISMIEKSKKDSEVRFYSEIEGITAMASVHRILASDPLNSPGILRHPNGD